MRFLNSWRIFSIVALVAGVTLPSFAAQMAILKNGFAIQHERHEVIGNVTRLYTSADGSSYVEVPTENIDHYEAVPDAARFARNVKTPSSYSGFPGRPETDLTEVVNEASGRYRLDPDLVNSVIKAESGFNARAVSPKGAQGLMQLMPGTASELGVSNVFDPQANVEGGTRYLRELLERYNFDLRKALAAYNAGPQRVEQFGGIPPYYETRAYVARVVKDFNKKKIAQQKAALPSQQDSTTQRDARKASTVPNKARNSKSVTQAKAEPSE
jgi:soluble lytic murein transglycosylase-like protein